MDRKADQRADHSDLMNYSKNKKEAGAFLCGPSCVLLFAFAETGIHPKPVLLLP